MAALQKSALQKKLADTRYWRILLHYQKQGKHWVSLINDPGFFLSAQGKTDPQAELSATIEALFGPGQPDQSSNRCRFVARYAWLREQLAVAGGPSPGAGCSEFEAVLQRVDPQSATLVFPGSYPNSPASMFGHTLLNFDGPYHSKQLSHAANYSAHTEESNGFAYALKGITGGYRGYFSLLPYYEKIKEYSGLERRDIWEYPLRLTRDEVRRMFFHLWELRGVYSDYYFFDENCSYNLLFLLEAARPAGHLTDPRPLWVMPIDTVRRLDRLGLVAAADYRPSTATRLAAATKGLSAQELSAIHGLVDEGSESGDETLQAFSGPSKIRILETAAQVVELQFVERQLDLADYRKKYLTFLSARSRLGPTGETLAQPQIPVRPDYGHGSSRFSLGFGYADSRWVRELRYRPVYHELSDAEDGYLPGSQIVLGQLALRFHEQSQHVRLQKLQLIDIVSLSPVNAFYRPVSWQVKLGLRQMRFDQDRRHAVAYFDSGCGYATQGDWGIGYLLLTGEGLISGELPNGGTIGIGAGGGLMGQVSEDWRGHIHFNQMNYFFGESFHNFSLHLDQNLRLNRNNSLSLEVARQRELNYWHTESLLFWNHYW